MTLATAVAHPNIAFIKYWGNQDQVLRLPSNGSISMNLDGLHSHTSVEFTSSLAGDKLLLDGKTASPEQTQRVTAFLDLVRGQAGIASPARVESRNNFPSGAGIASSSSAFAASWRPAQPPACSWTKLRSRAWPGAALALPAARCRAVLWNGGRAATLKAMPAVLPQRRTGTWWTALP
ncbi:MAG: hypothetical protein KIS80_06595 [Anaerolineales bacterium]|nr:hypothetical protein [Anaerolineales bacterium]